ncbi:MAG TPA: cytochrome c [Tepidisphaeraceae bacterium]
MAEDLRQNPLGDFRLKRPPFWLVAAFLVLIVISWLPLVVGARRRVSTSPEPKIHMIQDMDNQPKYKTQHVSPVFADGRADRPVIRGTVARGQLFEDDHYARGYSKAGANGQVTYFKGYPKQVQVNERLLKRGQMAFGIYCSHCHGLDGYGHGPVNDRAIDLGEPKWVQAASLHSDVVKQRPEGHIFNTITNGIRNMPGHSGQITIEDRWAIVAYVRALELSQDAPPNMAPPEKLANVK